MMQGIRAEKECMVKPIFICSMFYTSDCTLFTKIIAQCKETSHVAHSPYLCALRETGRVYIMYHAF